MIVLTSDEWFFATSNEWFFATSKKRISQQVNSDFCNEQLLQRVTSEFLQRAASATSNERFLQRVMRLILQRVTSNKWISTSNEQRVESYAYSKVEE